MFLSDRDSRVTESILLIGDIGGTNARFALADPAGDRFGEARSLACSNYDTAEDAVIDYLESKNVAEPAVICLAVAGPVIDQSVRITNNHWRVDAAELARRFSGVQVRLLNDFEAIAFAIPFHFRLRLNRGIASRQELMLTKRVME